MTAVEELESRVKNLEYSIEVTSRLVRDLLQCMREELPRLIQELCNCVRAVALAATVSNCLESVKVSKCMIYSESSIPRSEGELALYVLSRIVPRNSVLVQVSNTSITVIAKVGDKVLYVSGVVDRDFVQRLLHVVELLCGKCSR